MHAPDLKPDSITTPAFDAYLNPTLDSDVRTYGEPVLINGNRVATIQVAQALNGVEEVMNRLLVALAFGVPLVVITAAIGSYILVARALEPIDVMTRTARIISASDFCPIESAEEPMMKSAGLPKPSMRCSTGLNPHLSGSAAFSPMPRMNCARRSPRCNPS